MTDATLAALAALRLPTRALLPTEALDDDAFAELLDRCVSHRLLGLLGEAVGAGTMPVTPEQRDRLEQDLQSWASHVLRVERLTLRVLDSFAAAGIRVRVLKGLALAHTVYEVPELRVFGDVDLLVAGEDLARAQTVLEREFDGLRVQPELRPGFDRRFGKEVLVKCGAIEVDLHRVFVDGAFGLTIDVRDLFAPPYRFPLAGFELTALPMPQRLLHGAYAAAFGDWPPRFIAFRDVALMVIRERPNLIDVLMMAKAWRCEAVLACAVTGTWEQLHLTAEDPLVAWARSYEPDARSARLLAAHQGAGRMFKRHLAALEVLEGWGPRAAYLGAIAFPSREYLRARGLSPTRHLQRALHGIRTT